MDKHGLASARRPAQKEGMVRRGKRHANGGAIAKTHIIWQLPEISRSADNLFSEASGDP